MPNWQPNWQDVRWDWAAAERAASTLDQTANDLDWTDNERQRAAFQAAAQWRGSYREQFDARRSALIGDGREQARGYRAAATRIRWASRQAAEEQAHRVRERERWRREKEDEDRRAREAASRRAAERQKAQAAKP